MGLDMYLTKEIYIGAKHNHRNVNLEIKGTDFSGPILVDNKKVRSIIEEVGYWRKANAIHNWFVQNIQDGKDECEKHYVPYEKLTELKKLCEQILETKDHKLIEDKLPPTTGFFFGSTEIDEHYFSDLVDTIAIIDSLNPNGEYYYQSSW